MNTITIPQPHAQLIVEGHQQWITNDVPTEVRGDVLVVSDDQRPESGTEVAGSKVEWRTESPDRLIMHSDCGCYLPLHYGAVLAVAELTDCLFVVNSGEESAIRTVDLDDNGSLWLTEPERFPNPKDMGIELFNKWAVPLTKRSNFRPPDWMPGYEEFCQAEGLTTIDQTEISDQFPYCDWGVGRYAYKLTNIRPLSEPVFEYECDECDGRGVWLCRGCNGEGCIYCGHDGREGECRTCDGEGTLKVSGHTGIWTPEPALIEQVKELL